DNTYPGAACDVPSPLYSWSWALNPSWSRRYSPQAEILVYLEKAAAETGLKPHWAAEAFDDLATDVRQSIARIRTSPFIPRTDQVRGFVFDVATGRLDEVV
ncbi:MAG TPA: hypothetical protein VFI19_08540, partial [Nocardioides sp.]|nr:hypothetical protein [Nocardioides sp.]